MDYINPFATISSAAQGVYNLYKDITNTDNKRAQDVSENLMETQFGYNKQLQEMQQAYGREMFNRQVIANYASQARQFAYNSQLSNPARDAYLKRMAGLNPAENITSYSSQVSAPDAGLQSSSSPSVSAPSFGAVHYSPNDGVSLAAYKRDLETAESIRIANITALDEALARIDRYDAETEKLLSEKKINEEEAKLRSERSSRRREIVDAELKRQHAAAYRDEETGKIQDSLGRAAVKTSEAAEKQAEAVSERNEIERVRTSIEKFKAQTDRMQVNINAERLTSEISQLEALADKLSSEASLNYKELHYFDEAKQAAIDNIVADANLKDAKTINEYRGLVEGVVDDVLSDMISENEVYEIDKDGKKTTTKGFKGKGKWSRVAKLWRLIKK